MRFLYPVVKDFFETMRVHGKYIDAKDLEDDLQHTMQRYLDEAAKPNVAEALEGSNMAIRLEFVRRELARLRDPKTAPGVHIWRQQMLMRACGARLRTPSG